mmetsp:Transcript_31906/g.5776  ORF Transcript_31906/g.5776 Transcript_31906/m.5776 type:complete len:107 (+) Transcript_31906:928-1248(+)
MPNTVWIWDMNTLSLHVILNQILPIKSIEWSPKSIYLAFCTGNNRIYFWSLEGASVCDVPVDNDEFKVMKVKWAKDGKSLILMDKNAAIVVYPRFEILETYNEEYF